MQIKLNVKYKLKMLISLFYEMQLINKNINLVKLNIVKNI